MASYLTVAQDLIRFPSIIPQVRRRLVLISGKIARGADLTSTYEFAPGRPSLIARLAGRANLPPLCFTGHTDVVPLGAKPWTYAPFAGEVAGKKLCGRGSSDMKCGVARRRETTFA